VSGRVVEPARSDGRVAGDLTAAATGQPFPSNLSPDRQHLTPRIFPSQLRLCTGAASSSTNKPPPGRKRILLSFRSPGRFELNDIHAAVQQFYAGGKSCSSRQSWSGAASNGAQPNAQPLGIRLALCWPPSSSSHTNRERRSPAPPPQPCSFPPPPFSSSGWWTPTTGFRGPCFWSRTWERRLGRKGGSYRLGVRLASVGAWAGLTPAHTLIVHVGVMAWERR